MNVVETVAEGEAVSTPAPASHTHLNPGYHNLMRPAHNHSPNPVAPSTPPPAALQPVPSPMVSLAASAASPASKIQPSSFLFRFFFCEASWIFRCTVEAHFRFARFFFSSSSLFS